MNSLAHRFSKPKNSIRDASTHHIHTFDKFINNKMELHLFMSKPQTFKLRNPTSNKYAFNDDIN